MTSSKVVVVSEDDAERRHLSRPKQYERDRARGEQRAFQAAASYLRRRFATPLPEPSGEAGK